MSIAISFNTKVEWMNTIEILIRFLGRRRGREGSEGKGGNVNCSYSTTV